MEPAFFSAAHLFYQDRQEGEEEEADLNELAKEYTAVEDTANFLEREHLFPNMVLHIREFSFHQLNANLLWPGACSFAKWLDTHHHLFQGQCVLELGSGTGALAIFLKKAYSLDITTSDYDDKEIESNIAYNCKLNGVSTLPHIKHTWGETFPVCKPHWSLIIASDILLYTKQYENLIKSIKYLLEQYVSDACEEQVRSPTCDRRFLVCQDLKDISRLPVNTAQLVDTVTRTSNGDFHSFNYPDTEDLYKVTNGLQGREIQSRPPRKLPEPCFLMSWRRRIPRKDEAYFFEGCKRARLTVQDFGSRIYCISQSS